MISNLPLVSICCITYNHCDFIRQCLDGFIMQKTDFAFEIIVHDDASTDGTTDIVKEFEMKYPKLFKVIIQKENQYSKGVNVLSNVFSPATGKYIAYCEGDDYWTDPLKLQKQVDFLESNPDYVMSSHRFNILEDESGEIGPDWYGNLNTNIHYDIDTLVAFNEWYTQPLSIVFRRSSFDQSHFIKFQYTRDLVMVYHLLSKGQGVLLNEYMGVYRKHNGGVWTGVSLAMQRTSDIRACVAIYEVENSEKALNLLNNRLNQCRRLGLRYIWRNRKLLRQAYNIILDKLGLLAVVKLCVKTW